MTNKDYQEQFVFFLKKGFEITRPWRKQNPFDDKYEAGFNDCIKEIKKREKKFLEYLNKLEIK